MRHPRPFAALAACLVSASIDSVALASQDNPDLAFSGMPLLIDLCSANSVLTADGCKKSGTDKLVAELDHALQAALAKAPANIKPLLKRDQAWFGEMITSVVEEMSENPVTDRDALAKMLRGRLAALGQIESGFGRAGVVGTWQDAFGSVTVTAADDGAYRVAIATDAVYGTAEHRRWTCQATALVKPGADGWLTGEVPPEIPPEKTTVGKDYKNPGSKPGPGPLVAIKIRRQGETLRLVIDERDTRTDTRPHCYNIEPVTATYFASGPTDSAAAADKTDASFVLPTFDCTRPYSASDEETCADPELADDDQRLNRDWKTLLPRLDEATRHALSEDQRNWVRAQMHQYPYALHPAEAKVSSFMHYAGSARAALLRLQRGRMALLEGFDENRKGLGGVWLSYTAMLTVTQKHDGSVSAEGFKWFQGDWKGGCEYAIEGTVRDGAFRSDNKGTNDKGKNPDTLERDHAMLVVNRLDDVFAAKRPPSDDEDQQKCKRAPSISSTARLFPARPSPDFDNYP
jgi:uncharacterized protein YecT (DUF1311 family)